MKMSFFALTCNLVCASILLVADSCSADLVTEAIGTERGFNGEKAFQLSQELSADGQQNIEDFLSVDRENQVFLNDNAEAIAGSSEQAWPDSQSLLGSTQSADEVGSLGFLANERHPFNIVDPANTNLRGQLWASSKNQLAEKSGQNAPIRLARLITED